MNVRMTRALLLAAAVFSASALQAAAQSPPPECTIGKAIYSPVGSAREANKTYELVHSDRADLRRQGSARLLQSFTNISHGLFTHTAFGNPCLTRIG
jgi:hypothetical protein